MRIAYLNPRAAMGGAEVVLLNIITALRQAQPDWQISLITGDDGPLVARARTLGVSCRVIPFPKSIARLGDSAAGGPAGRQVSRLRLYTRLLVASPAVAISLIRLRRALRSINPDVIHTNGFKMHVLGALAKRAGTPLIWHMHDYVSARPLMTRLIKSLRKRCALVLAVSESVKRDIGRVCANDVKVQTLYNAVNTKEFSPEGERLDLDMLSGLAVNGSRQPFVRIGLLATFARWKGQDVFLRALSLLPPEINWRGYIIGGPIYSTDGSQFSLAELQMLAHQFGIANRVGFTGFVDQPAAAIRALDIVVHASTQPEPFGLTILEAMACGRPVIVSNAGGVAELIHLNVNVKSPGAKTRINLGGGGSNGIALGHSPGNAEDLTTRIAELARSEQLRASLSLAGREAVNEHFEVAQFATGLVPAYRSVSFQPAQD